MSSVGLFALSTALPAQAAVGINSQINYQGRLLTAAGAVVPDGTYNIRFKIYQDGTGTAAGNPGGTLKWTESWLVSNTQGVQIRNGYFSLQMGSLCSFNGGSCQGNTNTAIDFNQDTLFVSMDIGGTANTATPTYDGEMVPMKRLTADVYALNSAKLGGLTAAGFLQNIAPNAAQQTANLNLLSGAATTVAAAQIQAVASATAPVLILKGGATPGVGGDLLQLQSSTSAVLMKVDSSGALTAVGVNAGAGLLQGSAGLTISSGSVSLPNASIANAALQSSVTLQGNTFNGANQLVQLNASTQLPAVSGANVTNLNASALTTGTVASSVVSGAYGNVTGLGTLSSLTVNGTSSFTGAITVNTGVASGISLTSGATVPTADQLSITNAGSTGVTTAGVNGLSVNYKGGAAAVESAGLRIDLQPGTTSGGVWSAQRLVPAATGAVAGVTENGLKIDALTTPGAGTENAISVGAGWDNVLQSANFTVTQTGAVTGASFTGAHSGSGAGLTALNGTNISTGTVGVSVGGTGTNTFTSNGVLYGNGTGNLLVTAAAASAGQCLVSTAGAPTWAPCGSAGVTTVGAFSGTSIVNGASISGSTITFGPADASNPGMVTTGTQTFAGAKTFSTSVTTPQLTNAGTLTVGTTGSNTLQLQTNGTNRVTIDGTGNLNYVGGTFSLLNGASSRLVFDTSTALLKVYDAGGSGNFASISASSTGAVFSANTGTTQVGSGTGNVTSNLTGINDSFSFGKTYTAAAAYNNTDFSIQRAVTAGSFTTGGSVLTVSDLTSGTADAATVVTINQNNAAATGNILAAQLGGTNKLTLATSGNLNITGVYTNNGSPGVSTSCSGGNVVTNQTLSGGIVTGGTCSAITVSLQNAYVGSGSPAVITTTSAAKTIAFKAGTGFNSTSLFLVQGSGSQDLFDIDSVNRKIAIGGLGSHGAATTVLLVLDNKSDVAADPTNSAEGAMYYNSFSDNFRCYSDGMWVNCGVPQQDHSYAISDEFVGGGTTSNSIGSLGWTNTPFTAAGCTPSYQNASPADPDRPGVLDISVTAAVSTSGCNINLGTMALAPGQTIKTSVMMGQAAGMNSRIGILPAQLSNVNPNFGVYWKDNVTSSSWEYCYGTGTSNVCTTSGVALAANTWERLSIQVISVGASSTIIYGINGNIFTVNGVNLDSTNTRPNIQMNSTAAAAKDLYVDYFQVFSATSVAR